MKRISAKETLDWMGALFLVAVLALGLTGEWTHSMTAASVFSMTDGGDPPRIVLDAGHGGADGGAVGLTDGVREDGLNLAVAKLVEQELLAAGFDVTMTRKDENAIAKNKQADMRKRREIMRGEGVSAVVSIHMNKFSDRAVSGPMAFYMKGAQQGEALATAVISAVCESTGRPKRPANPGDYYVLRESAAPAVIIECGFLSNPDDERLLQDAAHQKKLAAGIAAGVAAYFAQNSAHVAS